jgi:NAD(P)-dependent dehydrogenase (short-subunit alcohol dehydrogenase family)
MGDETRHYADDALFTVRGRAVVITGGLGLIGQCASRAMLERGARVAILDLAVTDDVRAAWTDPADRLLMLRTDVVSRASLDAALAQISSRWGTPHALVNCAARDIRPDAPAAENGPFETYPEVAWDRVIETNLKGTFLACQTFGGAMAAAGRGSIVNVASTYGQVAPDQRIYEYRRSEGTPFYKPAAYGASKSALYAFTRYLATYWAPRGIRANVLTPGGVAAAQDERFVDEYVRRVPMGRMAAPDDYNGALVFLVSDASSYMTGANLVVDGGWTAW